ncbi:response regulator [Lysobacter ciconiae]|uniref:Response regulator n=1 Tax=Novilysobacter ciconiae TaxID=2781022 RepID=A0A7S6ZRW4_9GAMM|nr:response regulator [Lysobacter ciconiae]QOW18929.1 response regulator [Lysobacter ciconiae]
MNDPRGLPRILLVEDEPTSAAFLAAAARATPAHVDIAPDLATALVLASRNTYELWMFDATLPDGSGSDLLQRLREDRPGVPAIAHTASDDAAQLAALAGAGFIEVLRKPLPTAEVQAAVRRALHLPAHAAVTDPRTAETTVPMWDDRAAAAALNGNDEHVAILRGLFLDELPQACERIAAAVRADNVETVGAELHRLRASCGFVGAARLAVLVKRLQGEPSSPELLERFVDAARGALSQPPGSAARVS